MKRKRKLDLEAITPRAATILGLAIVGVATMRSAQATTTVDFGGLGHNVDISQTFADFASVDSTGYTVSLGAYVIGTPNIDLTWGSGASGQVDSYQNWDGRGTVAQVDFSRPASFTPVSITFTPDAGVGVLVNSFYMDLYSGGGPMDVDWSISDSFGTLASGNWTRASGGQDLISPIFSRDAILGSAVTLTFTRNAGTASYFAIDNLAFDQVPEPSTAGLLAVGLGLGAVVMRRRRK